MTIHHWSADEDDYIRNNYPKIGAKKCAFDIGRDVRHVEFRARQLNVKSRVRLVWTPEMVAYVKDHYKTETANKIAKDLGISKMALQKMTQKIGATKENPPIYLDVSVNDRFGSVTVKSVNGSFCHCICDCGKVINTTIFKLRTRYAKNNCCKSCPTNKFYKIRDLGVIILHNGKNVLLTRMI